MKILITICARGGSKGIPGKNIKPINGIPLIIYTINTAKLFSNLYRLESEIAISTDDKNISEICKSMGIEINYKRPLNLSTDTSGKIDTIYDLLIFQEKLKGLKYDYILDLDVTSPLRTIDDLSQAFESLQNNENALNIFSVNRASKNPYFNMVEQKEDGYYELSKKGEFLTRQSAKPVFELNASFYFYKRIFFESESRTVINSYSLIYEMKHICFDLDHPIDFEFMTYLIENNKLDFKF
jgi:CMP-N,N'-diacetyllegionaminic acid synthase